VKGAGTRLLIIIGLSLVAWVLCSYWKQPNQAETVVIVLICTLLVLVSLWLWERIQRIWRRGANGP